MFLHGLIHTDVQWYPHYAFFICFFFLFFMIILFVSRYLLCHVDSLSFVVPWHFQVVLVKIALNFVMCSLYIVFLAMFFLRLYPDKEPHRGLETSVF